MLDSFSSTTPDVADASQVTVAAPDALPPARSRNGTRAALGGLVVLLGALPAMLGHVSGILTSVSEIVKFVRPWVWWSDNQHDPQLDPWHQPSQPRPVPIAPLVTEEEYQACLRKGCPTQLFGDRGSCFGEEAPASDSPNPATCVSLDDAVAYCELSSRRLPTAKELLQAAAIPANGVDRSKPEWVTAGRMFPTPLPSRVEGYERQKNTRFRCVPKDQGTTEAAVPASGAGPDQRKTTE